MLRLGISGPHRTGKTTLARGLSEKCGVPFIATNVSKVFKDHGHPVTPQERLKIQQHILEHCVEIWDKAGSSFVTDRTPFDIAAYLVMESSSFPDNMYEEYTSLLKDCKKVLKSYFDAFIIVKSNGTMYDTGEDKVTGNCSRVTLCNMDVIFEGLNTGTLSVPSWTVYNVQAGDYNNLDKCFKKMKEWEGLVQWTF